MLKPLVLASSTYVGVYCTGGESHQSAFYTSTSAPPSIGYDRKGNDSFILIGWAGMTNDSFVLIVEVRVF